MDPEHARAEETDVKGEGVEHFVQGRFQVKRRLGQGAQGAVYAVYDTVRKHDVALKVLSRMDPNLLYRFKREFREVAEIVHPRLATLYEFFGVDGTFCFTMELVEGHDWYTHVTGQGAGLEDDETRTGIESNGSLDSGSSEFVTRSVIDTNEARPSSPPQYTATPQIPRVPPESKLDEARLRAGFRSLVDAVCFMHSAGKLHLDLKPSNVMVRADGEVCILDFGLTQSTTPEDGEAHGGGGTPAFMAPEQGKGRLTGAADWYAVGTMLYHALTGSLPFVGVPDAILAAKRARPPIHPGMLVKGLPKDLCDLAMEMLIRQPEHRAKESHIRQVAGLDNDGRRSSGLVTSDGSVCVGREHELGVLGRLFDRASSGGFHVSLVRGASGIGKSTVVETFLEHVANTKPDTWILRGRCYETEFLPYRGMDGVMDQLSGRLGTIDREARRGLLPKNFLALTEIFPVLRRSADGSLVPPPDGHGDALEAKKRGVLALRELLTRLRQDRPLILYVDDMQWADADTLSLLLDMFVPSDAPPVLLLMTAREDELAELPELQETLANLNDWSESFTMLDLAPLEHDALASLARMESDTLTDERVEQLIADSGGSPFLLQELLRSEASGVSGGLDEILLRRVHGLGSYSRALVEVLAVAGRPLERDVAFECAAGDAPRENPSAVIAQLKNARLIRVRGGGHEADRLECYHDRIRESVADSLSETLGYSMHLRIADALIGRQANPEHIVQHLLSGNDTARIAPHALAAAESASTSFAFERAAHFLEMAESYGQATGVEKANIQARRAWAMIRAGRSQQAVPVLLAAAEHHEDRLLLMGRAAGHLMEGGRISDGIRVAETVIKEVGAHMPKSQFGAFMMFLASDIRLRLRRFKLGTVKNEVKRAHLTRVADTYIAFAKGFNVAVPAHSAAFFAKTSLIGAQLGDSRRFAIGLGGHAGMIAAFFPKQAWKLIHIAHEQAQRSGDTIAKMYALAGEAYAYYFDTRFEECYNTSSKALRTLATLPTRNAFEEERMQLIQVFSMLYLGRQQEIRQAIPKMVRDMERRGDEYGAAMLKTAAGSSYYCIQDQPGRIVDDLASLAAFEHTPGDYMSFYAALARCNLALYMDDPEDAYQHILSERKAWLKSGMIRMPLGDAIYRSVRAQLGMRMLGRFTPAQAKAFRRMIARDAKRLSGSKFQYAKVVGAMLSSSVAAAHGDRAATIAYLADAAERTEPMGMMISYQALQWLRGKLMGGEEGEALCTAAESKLKSQGTVNPARFMRLFTPFPPELLVEIDPSHQGDA